jgi:dTDP-4-dehydrorhamnose 3,5-epimerase
MNVAATALPGVLLIEPRVFADNRGCFLEIYQSERYSGSGLPARFVQDNVSYSVKNVLRGMHYQTGRPQGKLVMALEGEIFDVVVDIRRASPTYGKWIGTTLSSQNYRQLYVPEGFAHGFCVTSESAIVLYKCTDYYSPLDERGIRWDDPVLSMDWPVSSPVLSEKDRRYPALREVPREELPVWKPGGSG